MGRIRHGWELTKKSWALLRGNRQLFRFPIYSALSALVVVVVSIGPGVYLIDDGQHVLGGALTAIGIFVAAFVGTYFGVGLAATADAIFHGRDATFADGMAVARQRVGAIAGWAALSAIVGMIFAVLREGGSVAEAIIGTVGAAAWSLITFLAVPVIAIEGLGPVATLKRSASLFKERWAGQVTGNVAIGGIVLLLGVLPALVLIGGGVLLWLSDDGSAGLAAGAVIAVVGVALLVVSLLIVQAMRGIFGVALYRFASDGEVASGFTQADLESAVRTRGAPATTTV
jgi:Family of unknown function (DUF6159)